MAKVIFEDYEPGSCQEIFGAINARQITALMFHDSMADLFDFLGLKGFKRLHEYQYLSESIEHRKLKGYFLNSHGKLLETEELEPVGVIPEDWYKYDRMDVPSTVRKQTVQRAMEQYKDWESGTKELYQKCASYLLAWQKVEDFNRVNKLVQEVSCELKKVERLLLELRAVDFDMVHVVSIQQEYHDKYKSTRS